MNMRMILVSLLAVTTLSRAELNNNDLLARVLAQVAKVECSEEYQELAKFRKETEMLRNVQHGLVKDCYLNNSLLAYFSNECRMARDFKRAVELRELQEKELLAKAQATPECLEVYSLCKK